MYVCGNGAGKTTSSSVSAVSPLTTAVVNAAWASRTVVPYANATTDLGFGVNAVDYFIVRYFWRLICLSVCLLLN